MWETVIGLEVHTQLSTHTKIFSGAATAYGAEPNAQACLIDAALPGVLPVLNHRAVEYAIRLGLAIGASLHPRSVFARKNYFYPDLPKGYQISQYDAPIVFDGHLTIDTPTGEKTIHIVRAHLEEDAGKSLHEQFYGQSGIDLNRAGTPLLEIVTAPDFANAREAVSYLKQLHQLVRHLDICDGNLQEGSFRCDANVSVRRPDEPLGTRTEIKNLNSFRFVEQAIDYEVARQIDLIEGGGRVTQETRLFDADRGETRPMRSKEDAHDYRYFPDPDLLPVVITADDIARVQASMPELPRAKKARYLAAGLREDDVDILLASVGLCRYFEALTAAVGGEERLCANWLLQDLSALLNKRGLAIDHSPMGADRLAALLKRVLDGTLSGKLAKTLFEELADSDASVDALIAAKGVQQIDDAAVIDAWVDGVIAAYPDQVAQYRAGKDKVFGFLVGQVMKQAKGQANPQALNDCLKRKLAP